MDREIHAYPLLRKKWFSLRTSLGAWHGKLTLKMRHPSWLKPVGGLVVGENTTAYFSLS